MHPSRHCVPAGCSTQPDAHCVQTELAALVHVSALTHCAIGVHAEHTVGVPVFRQYPLAHVVQTEFAAVEQVRELVQCWTDVHTSHCPVATFR